MEKYKIPDRHLSGFQNLSEMPEDVSSKILEFLESLPFDSTVESMFQSKGFNSLSKEVIEEVKLIEIIDVLYSLERLRLEVEEPFEDILRGLVENETGNIKNTDLAIKNIMNLISGSSILRLLVKSDILKTEHGKLFLKNRIFSEIRPVFNDENDIHVTGGLVYYNLKVEYLENGKKKSAFFTLNNSDLQSLSAQIERAKSKGAILKEKLGKSLNIKIV